MNCRSMLVGMLLLLTSITSASGQEAVTIVKADAVPWKPHPIFRGAHNTTVIGDPSKAVPIVQRNRFPAGFKIPPHTHPYDEVITILAGTLGFGVGDKLDTDKGQVLAAGSVITIKAGQPHFVWTTSEEATIQIHFAGPGGIAFPNPADDPRKK